MRSVVISALLATVGVPLSEARADNFANARYDATTDQLVVTMRYRGTNPNHNFSLRWGECKSPSADARPEIVAEVLDDQWQDKAEHGYQKTTRFDLTGVTCRPATLTLRTAPRFYYTMALPAGPTSR